LPLETGLVWRQSTQSILFWTMCSTCVEEFSAGEKWMPSIFDAGEAFCVSMGASGPSG
jgi:hypothetical protein